MILINLLILGSAIADLLRLLRAMPTTFQAHQ